MRKNYDWESFKIIPILFALLIAASTALGSVYLMKRGEGYTGLHEYLSSFFKDTVSGVDKYAVFKSTLKSDLIMLCVVFVSGFFRIGFLAAAACILKKGFVTGFTSAAFMSCFGLKGLLISLAYLPSMLLIIPAFIAFCAVSTGFSFKKDRFQKKIIFSYIFFTIAVITIFCAASFLEGYLTTTFMTHLAPGL